MASMTLMSIVGLFVLAIFILLPIVVGVVLILRFRRRGPAYPACGGCGYDVSQTVGTAARCPECGQEFVQVGIVPPGGRRNPALFWLGCALVVFPLTCGGVLSMFTAVGVRSASQARQRAVMAQQQALAAQQQLQAAQAAQAAQQAQPLPPPSPTAADPTLVVELPPPLTEQQIQGMNADEARRALERVSVARRYAIGSPEDKARLKREFAQLLDRISALKGGS